MLSIRRHEPNASYRDRNASLLTLMRTKQGWDQHRRARFWIAVGILSSVAVFQLVVGAIVHVVPILGSGGLFGAIAFALVATTWNRGSWVKVTSAHLRAFCDGARLDVPRADVEEVGIGREAKSRTLWVRVRGRGRQLVLDQLTDAEADSAAATLRGELALA